VRTALIEVLRTGMNAERAGTAPGLVLDRNPDESRGAGQFWRLQLHAREPG